jgi:predicted enzyme related to lactoylglutathione lyase
MMFLMTNPSGLGQFPIVAFVTIRDPERAKPFYRDVLGLPLTGEELPYALVFDCNGTMLRLAIDPESPPIRGTVLCWRVTHIEDKVRQLMEAGVVFERWPFLVQDDLAIWCTPTGAKVAWFKDSEGNLLSVSQMPE